MNSNTSNNQVIEKQLIINSLIDDCFIANLVKEFCFIDRLMYETKQHLKNNVLPAIHNAVTRRKEFTYGLELDEFWSFAFIPGFVPPMFHNERLMLYASNCRFCGNYLSVHSDVFTMNIQCRCDRIQNQIEHESRAYRQLSWNYARNENDDFMNEIERIRHEDENFNIVTDDIQIVRSTNRNNMVVPTFVDFEEFDFMEEEDDIDDMYDDVDNIIGW